MREEHAELRRLLAEIAVGLASSDGAPRTTPLASLTALLVTATLIVIARLWRWVFDGTHELMDPRPHRRYADELRVLLTTTQATPWVWVFAWGLVELSMTHSPSISTLLLVTYFAATAVGAVAAGRIRRSAPLRQIGLGLALAAAATSVYGASTYFDIGIRIVGHAERRLSGDDRLVPATGDGLAQNLL